MPGAPVGRARFAWGAGLLVALAAILVLTVHAWRYLPFIADDALISLRYAERLVQGKGLTWTDGERVEGYSNLLWVLCVAAAHALGIDPICAARVLGVLGMAATIGAIVYASVPRSIGEALPALASSLGVALCAPIAVWAIGGMEQPLLAALVAWALVLCYPLIEREDVGLTHLMVPGVLLALACLTRPDGVLFTVAVCVGIALARGLGGASILTTVALAIPSLFACIGQLALRLVYYGEWLPNTAYVKLVFTPQRLAEGLRYLGEGAWSLGGLLALAAVGLFAGVGDVTFRRRAILLAAPLLLWSAYVAAIGGDIFPAWRHLIIVVVIAALLAAQGLAWLLRRLAAPKWVLWFTTALLLGFLLVQQWRDPEDRRALRERWEWDGEVIGLLLKHAFGAQKPLMAVDSAGCLPYFSDLPALDMLGLNDRHIARTRPPWFGRGSLGHELGDGAYVLSLLPDLVVFCSPAGRDTPCSLSGFQMATDPRFRLEYALITFEGRVPYTFRSRIWARKERGRIGVERSASRVVVPGFLLSTGADTAARLDPGGQLVTTLPPGGRTVYRGLPFSSGRWIGAVESSGSPVGIRLYGSLTGEIVAVGERRFSFQTDQPTALDIELTGLKGEPAEIARLTFERE